MNSNLDPVGLFRRRQFNRFILIGIGLLLSVGALFTLYLLIQREAGLILETNQKRAQVLGGLNAIAVLGGEEQKAEEVLGRLTRTLPAIIEIPSEIVPRIQGLARARQLQLELKLGESGLRGGEGLSAIDFSLRADGTLRNVVYFVSDLEAERTVLRVGRWNIRSVGGNKFQLELGGAIYARGES